MLASLGLDVQLLASSYDEVSLPGCSPRETAAIHARGKIDGAPASDRLTISADTVVDLDGRALGKPRDAAESRAMIGALSGRSHLVHTAFALRDPAGAVRHLETVTTTVTFGALDNATIDAYVAGGDGRDKAGAYGIQGFAATLVERIDGDYFTVVGFPLAAFARALPPLGLHLRPAIRVAA